MGGFAMRESLFLTLLIAVLLAVGLVSFGVAADRYVDAASGDNDNDGSEGSPWKTITFAGVFVYILG
jgi:hypothetical protein